MTQRPLRIEWMDLEFALTGSPAGMVAWHLDLETGELLTELADPGMNEGEEDFDLSRYWRVPHVEGHEEYREMETFAQEVEERDLRKHLIDALTGKGAFRRFRAVLDRYPDLRDAWRARRDAWLQQYARQWLADIGVVAEFVQSTPIAPPPPIPSRRPRRPSLLHVLLLGAPDGKTEIIDGRVRRRASGGGAPRALFKDLVRDLCALQDVGYRKRFVEGTDSYRHEDIEIRIRGEDVEVLVEVPADIVPWFYR